MHVDRLPVMAFDPVNVASASHSSFTQLSLTYRAGETRIEKDARAAEEEQEMRMRMRMRGLNSKRKTKEGDL